MKVKVLYNTDWYSMESNINNNFTDFVTFEIFVIVIASYVYDNAFKFYQKSAEYASSVVFYSNSTENQIL